MGTEVGDAYIEVHADTKGLGREIKRAAKLAGQDFGNGFADGVDFKGLDKSADKFFSNSRWAERGDRTGRAFSNAHRRRIGQGMDNTVKLVLGLIAAIGPQMAALGSALSAQLTAILGSLVVAAGGVAAAFAGIGVAAVTAGAVGFSAFRELLEQSTALKGALDSLSAAWGQVVSAAAAEWAPALTGALGELASMLAAASDALGSGIGTALAQISSAFGALVSSPGWTAFMQALSGDLMSGFASVGTGFVSVLGGILTLLTAAAPAAAELGAAFAGWAEGFAASMAAMAESGQLQTFFDAAVSSMSALTGLLGPLTKALGNVFLIGSEAGNTLLTTLGDLAQTFLEFTQSAAGQASIGQWFSQSVPVFNALLDLIGSLGTALSSLVTPATLNSVTSFLTNLAGFLPVLAGVMAAIGNIGILDLVGQALTAIGTALAPVLPALQMLGAALGANLGTIIAALQPALNALAQVIGVVAGALGPLIGQVVVALMPAFTALTPLITMIGQLLGGLAPVLSALISAFAPIIQTVAQVAVQLGSALMPVIEALLPILTMLAPTIVQIVVAFNPFLRIFTLLLPVLMPVVDLLSDLLTWVLKLITPVAGFANDIGVLVAQFLGMNKVMGSVGKFLVNLGRSFSGLAGKMIDGLTKGIASVGNFFGGLPGRIMNWMLEAGTTMLMVGQNLLVGLGRGLINGFSVVRAAIAGVIAKIIDFFKSLFGISSPSTVFADFGKNLLQGLVNGITSLVSTVVSTFAGLFVKIATSVAAGIVKVVTLFGNLAVKVITAVTAMVVKIVAAIVGLWVKIGTAVATGVLKVVSSFAALGVKVLKIITTFVGNVVTGFIRLFVQSVAAVASGIGKIIAFFAGLPARVLSALATIGSQLLSLFSKAMTNASTAVSDGVTRVLTFFKELPGKILAGLGDLGSLLVGAGGDLIGGLVKGIGDAAGKAIAKAKEVAGNILSGVKGFFGISSPSKVFAEIGQDLIAGLGVGIASSKSLSDLQSALGKVSKTITESMKDAIDERAAQLVAARKAENAAIRAWNKSRPKGAKARDLLPSLNMTEARKLAEQQMSGLTATVRKIQAELDHQARSSSKRVAALFNALGAKGTNLAAFKRAISSEKVTLGDLAAAREQLAERIKDATDALEAAVQARTDFANSIAAAARKYGSALNAVSEAEKGQQLTSETVVKTMKARLAEIKDFNADVTRLRKAGLNDQTLREIIEAGAEEGGKLADALLEGGDDAIKQVNKLQDELSRQAESLGKKSAGYFYDAGVESAKGVLAGLKSQDQALAEAMKKLARKLLRSFKSELGIRSPSRAFMLPGREISAGIAEGVLQNRHKIDNALAEVTTGSLTSPTISPAAAAAAGSAGVPLGTSSAALSRTVNVAPGAVVVQTANADPAQVANAVLDRLVARTK